MQAPVRGQELEVERGFVLGDAADGAAIAQPDRHSSVGHSAAAPSATAAARLNWRCTGLAQGLFNLRWCSFASDVRRSGPTTLPGSMGNPRTIWQLVQCPFPVKNRWPASASPERFGTMGRRRFAI